MDKNQDKNFYGLSVRGYQYAITPSRIDHALFMEAKQNLYNPRDFVVRVGFCKIN